MNAQKLTVEHFRRMWGDHNAMAYVFSDCRFRGLEIGPKLLALYCMRGPQTGPLGLQKFSLADTSETLEITREEAECWMHEVVEAFDWRWDPEARVLWMVDHCRRRARPTQAAVRRALRDVFNLPYSPVAELFLTYGAAYNPGFDEIWQSFLQSILNPQPRTSSTAPRRAADQRAAEQTASPVESQGQDAQGQCGPSSTCRASEACQDAESNCLPFPGLDGSHAINKAKKG